MTARDMLPFASAACVKTPAGRYGASSADRIPASILGDMDMAGMVKNRGTRGIRFVFGLIANGNMSLPAPKSQTR